MDYHDGQGYWITMVGKASGLPLWARLVDYHGGQG